MNGTDSGHNDERRSNADPWIRAVGDVAAPLLAGFSLASVITVTASIDQFRWPGGVILLLTIAAVSFIAAVRYVTRLGLSSSYIEPNPRQLWFMYHLGIIALLGGLGLALFPRHGVGMEENLRRVASGVAFAACALEFLNLVKVAWRVRRGRYAATDPRIR
jgi:hypothetical protein